MKCLPISSRGGGLADGRLGPAGLGMWPVINDESFHQIQTACKVECLILCCT
jgi:hypothetical protein